MGTPRAIAASFLFAISGIVGPAVAQQQAAPAPVEIERSYATALIRDVLAAVNHGNWTGNYTVLRDYADAEFAASNDPTRLAGLFTAMRAERLDLLPAMTAEPVILETDLTADSQQMRLVGYFPLQPRHVSFDLTFSRSLSRWLITGMSVGAFEPIAPGELDR